MGKNKNSTDKPFFSVVIPLYNKQPHIAQAIKSVIAQTEDDFEVIIVNDASTDGSRSVVTDFFSDPRIRIIDRNEPGPGGYAARNTGIEYAKGDWIAFLDADDEWYPEHLEKMRQLAMLYPSVGFMGCGWNVFDKGRVKECGYHRKYKFRGSHILSVREYLRSCIDSTRPVWTSIVCVKNKTPVVNRLFPEDSKAKRGGDLYAWLKLICYYQNMAWSDHLGAVYYRNSVNMVTKTAPSSPVLMDRLIYDTLGKNLSNVEKRMLAKHFNQLLNNSWIRNYRQNHRNFSILNKLYWDSAFTNSLCLIMFSVVPRIIHGFIIKLKWRGLRSLQ